MLTDSPPSVIPGGSLKDSAYVSGVVFHKNVSHKSMIKEGGVCNPRLMLLDGSIEYTRKENKITSIDTLLQQEEKYTEILLSKITKLRPDVLIVGRSVSRRAQELLLQKNIVLLQHVKSSLLYRIARQTGANVLSGTDHVLTQFGAAVLGMCVRAIIFIYLLFKTNRSFSIFLYPSVFF